MSNTERPEHCSMIITPTVASKSDVCQKSVRSPAISRDATMTGSTVATDDGRWFLLNDAEDWEVHDGTLFQIGETWAVLDAVALLFHAPAKIVTQQEALTWLTSRVFEVPDVLAKFADASRVKVES